LKAVEVAIAVRAVTVQMDSEAYDQTQRGRYGKHGYLFNIDQPTNPETGDITPYGPGTIEPSDFADV
jgi:hypothetical protein